MPQKKKAKVVKREPKECVNCTRTTTNYYPIKDKKAVCDECWPLYCAREQRMFESRVAPKTYNDERRRK